MLPAEISTTRTAPSRHRVGPFAFLRAGQRGFWVMVTFRIGPGTVMVFFCPGLIVIRLVAIRFHLLSLVDAQLLLLVADTLVLGRTAVEDAAG